MHACMVGGGVQRDLGMKVLTTIKCHTASHDGTAVVFQSNPAFVRVHLEIDEKLPLSSDVSADKYPS